ncbi:MAG: ABC transporter permease [Candidatus Magasanikbacteria bacterium]|nr:ABC transporter permease [Candidatus Magasanikbacteria bacterium]
MLKNFLILTLKSIRHRSTRSWLTILGIVIGIMLVVIILALSSGIKNTIAGALQTFGSDLIIIFPGKENNPIVGFLAGQKFREKDLVDLEKINGVKFAVPMGIGNLNIEHNGEVKSTMIHAANWKKYVEVLESSQGIKLETGRWPENDEVSEVVFGHLAAKTFFKKEVMVGDEVIIKSKRFKVVGNLSEIGEQMIDNVIFVSLDRLDSLTDSRGVSSALVKVMPGANINLVAQQIKFQLSKQEVIRDFSVLTPEKADRLIDNVISIVELVLMIIALVSLVVGAVGIMNTMYTSVLERTKQIGVMKAIGASDDAILSLFLIESGFIGLVGGILGIFFGILSAYFIGLTAAGFGIRGLFSFASLDFFGLFVILFLTFIIGVLSGVLPAKQASRMEPAEALRYE